MKAGISTASLFPRQSTEQAVSTIKALGVDLIEVFFSTFYEYRPEFSAQLRRETAALTVNSVHANSIHFEPNFFNPTRRVKGDGFYWLDQVARSAQLLDCKNYTFHGFHRLAGGGADDYDSLAGYLGEAAAFAANYGLNLCLENVHWCTYNRPRFFTEMKKRIPSLLGVFDIKQARRSGYPWQMYIADMAGSIAYAHLSDIDENGRMCLPGKGVYDFKEILARLKDAGFDGGLIIEAYGNDYLNDGELKQSYEFLSEAVYRLG